MKRGIKEKFESIKYTNIIILSICFMLLISGTVLAGEDKAFSEENVDTNKTQWTVKFKGEYYKGSINNNTLYVIKESTKEKITCTYSYPDTSTVVIKPKTALTAGEKYTVIVTNEIKNKTKDKNITSSAQKSFNVKQALQITKIADIDMITVTKGEEANLPKQVEVIYSDDSTGYVDVTWGSVSTSTTGTKTVTGKIKNSDLKPVIKVKVENENDNADDDESTDEKYIYDVDMDYYSYLGIYKVKVKTSSQVFNVYLGNTKMDYEGENIYTTTIPLKKGEVVKIKAYGYDKTLLDSKEKTIN